MVYYDFSPALILILSVLAKRLAEMSISDMTYIVLSGTLNLHSINQSTFWIIIMQIDTFDVNMS